MYLSTRGTLPRDVRSDDVAGGRLAVSTSPPRGATKIVTAQLVGLGATSMLTDVSSEMVTSIIPLYLTASLGLTIVTFALVDAGQQLVSAVLRFWSGPRADRTGGYKSLAMTGYGLSALCRFGLLLGGTGLTTAALWIDRVGKGIRVAPRDAMVARAAPPDRVGVAFGVHRAFDTAGALAGPLIAAYVLHAGAGAYDAVFAVAAAAAVAGLLVLYGFVRNPVSRARRAEGERRGLPRWSELAPGVRRLSVIAALLGVVTVPDGMIYLAVAPDDPADFPLLVAGAAFVYLLASVPLGWLADRHGPRRMLIGGHVALLALYVIGAASAGRSAYVCAALLGLFYAASDGVLAAFAARVADHRSGTAIAAVTGASIAGRVVASITFALIWTRVDDLRLAFAVLAVAVVVVVPLANRRLREVTG